MSITSKWLALSLLSLGCQEVDPSPDLDTHAELDSSSDLDTSQDTDSPTSTLRQGGIIECEDPTLRETLGPLALADLGPGWLQQRADDETAEDFRYGYGLAVGDLNGDGWPDIVLAHLTRPQLWMGSAQGEWSEEGRSRIAIPKDREGTDSGSSILPSLSDIDGDGDLDLYLAMDDISDQIYLNDGDGYFENWTLESGLPSTIEGTRALSWGDLDGDLDLDLVVGANGQEEGDYGEPNYLLINDGTGRFEDRSEVLMEEDRLGYTQVVGILDVDGDGPQDIYIINHRPEYVGNRLLFNDGSMNLSTEVEAGANLEMQGMGLGIGDLNDDRLPDLFIADSFGLKLLLSSGPRQWVEGAVARGLTIDSDRGQQASWSTHLEDMNNDGLLDAAAAFGPVTQALDAGMDLLQPDELWLQQADGQFEAVGEEWGLAHTGYGRALALVDLNQDGHLDWLLNSRHVPAVALLSRCSDSSWLRIELRDSAPNTWAIGSQIEVEASGQRYRRWWTLGSTGMSVSQTTGIHLGLGAAEHIDRLTVTWPDGEEEVWEDLTPRQIIRITR